MEKLGVADVIIYLFILSLFCISLIRLEDKTAVMNRTIKQQT